MSCVYVKGERERVRGKGELDQDVCNQATAPQFALPENAHAGHGKNEMAITGRDDCPSPASQIHCIKLVLMTACALQRSA